MSSVEFLQAFAEAWNEHDLDQIMEFMTDERVFRSSTGSEGKGKEGVRAVFQRILKGMPEMRFSDDEHFVSGDRGLSQWTLTGTDADDGSSIRVHGCDIFRFSGGKIAVKDSYLKQQGG